MGCFFENWLPLLWSLELDLLFEEEPSGWLIYEVNLFDWKGRWSFIFLFLSYEDCVW